ncbi:unnamed protein product [Cladocopium goreaui]|uniref:Protein URA2 n=1 Tax=Cladocopium goreaui TaxID=2562237 RepID=A0A9P1GJV1_9DINO|nr:unnamed protein product [Cladocopium goreaui]
MLPLIRKPQGLTYRLASDFVVPGGAAGRLSATRTIRTAQTDRLGVNPGRGSSATAVRAFDGAAWESSSSSSALDLPIGMAETVVGLAALYAIMSMAEYVYHRYFQHLGLNKVGAVRTVRKTFKLNTFQGDGHVEHHRETLDDMTLDVEPGRELVLDIDPFRGAGAGDQLQYQLPMAWYFEDVYWRLSVGFPYAYFPGWSAQVIVPVVVSAMLFHALLWNALHPHMHGLPDVPLEVGAPSWVLKAFRDSALFNFLRENHAGHHRAVGSHGNYNVCCPGVDQIVGTNVDPVTGVPQPKPVPDWVAPLCLLAITPLMPAMVLLCLVVLVTYPPLPRATAK